MPLSRESCHEAAHVLAAQWAGFELRGARVDGGRGHTRCVPPAGLGTASDVERLAIASCVYDVTGLAGERLFDGREDEEGARHDLELLKATYAEWPQWTRWARTFEVFKAACLEIAVEALTEDMPQWRSVASLLQSYDSITQSDLAHLGPFRKWLAPGADWLPAFDDLATKANRRLGLELKSLEDRLTYQRRYAQLQAQIKATQAKPEEPRTTFHPPRVRELMSTWVW